MGLQQQCSSRRARVFGLISAAIIGAIVIYIAFRLFSGGMQFSVELIPSPRTRVGTRCHWDVASQSLYYCDVNGNDSAILRYDYKEDKVYAAGIAGEIVTPFVIPIADTTNDLAVGLGRRVGRVEWDGKSPKATLKGIVFEVDSDKPGNRFNAAKADPAGRFYGGTMDSDDGFNKATGKVFRYVKGEGVTKVFDNIFISNGMAWDEKSNKFYYIDTGRFDVRGYDYNPSNGNISNEKVIINYSKNGKHPGFAPDGLTIDTDGNLYVTFFGGSRVDKVDPRNGEILLEIPIPAKQVTAVAFGGPNLDILYVVTASIEDDKTESSGCLYRITGLGTKGFPGVKVIM
ncbi:hypothetical protein HA402_008847 [Bradysia odoriphaga]|nr:hypothetical protein HA402_008847 [Bradysia odoriphaga]